MGDGWIYVLMTASDLGRYKVGFTKNNPMIRYKQLRTGDPKLCFEVGYYIPSTLGIKLSLLERAIHNFLGPSIDFYDEGKSEWFKGDPRNAWLDLEMIFEDLELEVTDYLDIDNNKIVRFWEEGVNSFYGPGLPLDETGFPIF